MADVQAKRDAAVKAKDDARKQQNEDIKAKKQAAAAGRAAEADKEAAAKKKKEEEKEALNKKRAENIAAKEAGRNDKAKQKSKYSKKDVFELKAVFDEYDKDGSGKVTLDEFSRSLKEKKQASAPRPGEKSTLAQRQAAKGTSILDLSEGVFHEMDTNGDGDVSFEELLKLFYRFANQSEIETMLSWVAPEPEPEPEPKPELSAAAKKQINDIFKLYDKDKSGSLSASELQKALEKTGIEREEIKEMFKAYDENGDEQISKEEFHALMESTGAFDDL